jgi:hypothetical protein
LIFPNAVERDNRVAAGTRRQVPGESTGVAFRITPPFGNESLQIISAPQPLPELERIVEAGQGTVPTLRADILSQWCDKWSAEQSLFAIHDSEFETRPAAGHGEQFEAALGQ